MSLCRRVYEGDIEEVRKMLEDPRNVSNRTLIGNTALHTACVRGFTDIAALLLSYGIDQYLTNRQGSTPLHIAAEKNRIDIARLLVSNGDGRMVEDNMGYTPIQKAAHKDNIDILSILLYDGHILSDSQLSHYSRNVRETVRMHPKSIFSNRSRSKEYMSERYHDILIICHI